MKKRIFIVEDEIKLRNAIADFLKLYDYDVIGAGDGVEAVDIINEKVESIDLVLLDIMLPGLDGQEVLKAIREISNVPVIMMTAKAGDYEQLKSFNNGVDDYIKKPIVLAVLKSRIEAVLKRSSKTSDTKNEEDERIQVGDISLDSMAQKVYYKDKHIITTPKEFKVMEFLMTNKNIALKREQILSNVWGDDYNGTDRTVDTIIKQLRIKLGDGGKYIKSIYGMGYIFDESEE